MRCGSMASSSQPGGAEQPVPLFCWSSPAQVTLPAVLRPARRFVPSAGRRDKERTRSAGQQVMWPHPLSGNRTAWPHAKRTLSLAMSCRWRQGQRGGRGSKAPVSEPARPGTGPGSRGPQRAAGRRARCQRGQHRQASPYAGGAAAGKGPWLPQPVVAILVILLDQRQGRHLLVLE